MVLLTDKPLKISRESYIEPARRGGLFVFGLFPEERDSYWFIGVRQILSRDVLDLNIVLLWPGITAFLINIVAFHQY